MRLSTDPEVEKFRAEFAAFLDAHLPTEAEAMPRPRSSSDMPRWAGRWQRALFDAGWLLPGNPPEYGGRNATLPQQLACLEELSERRIYHSFNPQGLGIIAASILTFGTHQQKQRWAVPILRAEITASLGMSEPGAGSDLAGLRTRAVLAGEHFVVNGQKVWTSGAHDADVLLTFVRTDPDAPKHKGISVLLIPTSTEGVVAAVQGKCIAGGLLLCWPCDLIVAADNAQFSDPVVFMGIGGVEYHGHTWELGPRKAKEILFTGRAVTAEEAEKVGMVNRVVPLAELDTATMELARQIAQMHPFALRQAKRAVNQTLDVQGFYAAIQSVFDIHQTGHGNALSVGGYPILTRLADMKERIKAQ